MNIQLENTGRRFNREWIFRNVDLEFRSGESVAVTGSNGSGKSTFLQMISGFLQPSEGKMSYIRNQQEIKPENIYRYISLCSPFLELYEELTAEECYNLHSGLKPLAINSWNEFSEILQLSNTRNKQLRYYSSGMRQRVKLALAILSKSDVLFLDEPCSNLDIQAVSWYKKLLEENRQQRIILISSNNQKDEIFICNREIMMSSLKKEKV